ncbi:MAG: alpha-ketoglutarate-dependent dioxygenase AlkB [Hyphomicrobiales bacterium]
MEHGESLPAGAFYVPSFLDAASQDAAVAAIDSAPWSTELRRRVQHFGYRYDYRARTVTSDAYLGPLPTWSDAIVQDLIDAAWLSKAPDQLIVNEYMPGQGIAAHIDCVPCFGDTIVSVSLLSACEMRFRDRKTGGQLAIGLAPRSALVLTGPARFGWTHQIPARKSDLIAGQRQKRSRRLSLTFRSTAKHLGLASSRVNQPFRA